VAFPSVVAVNGGNSGGNTTTSTINLPDGSNVSGRRVLVIFYKDGTSGTITWPSGWTAAQTRSTLQSHDFEARYRDIDGTEGFDGTGDTISITHNTEGTAHTTYLIEAGTFDPAEAPVVGTIASAAASSPNPPNCNPGTAKDYLFIACCSVDGNVAVTGAPTNYTNLRNDRWANSNGGGVASARRELNASSDDPGTFTATGNWQAQTIAIHPSAGGVSGTGSVALAIGVAGTATAPVVGSGAAALALGVAGAGVAPVVGSGSVLLELGVSGTGTVLVQGAGTVPLQIGTDGTGTGPADVEGAGNVAFTLGVSGTAVAPVVGTGTVLIELGVAGAGVAPVVATGATLLQIGVAGTAVAPLVGSGTIALTLGVSGTAAGAPISGVGTVLLTIGVVGFGVGPVPVVQFTSRARRLHPANAHLIVRRLLAINDATGTLQPATGLTDMTAFLSATPKGGALHPTLSAPMIERDGAPGVYVAELRGAHLASFLSVDQIVYERVQLNGEDYDDSVPLLVARRAAGSV
jgi:hypothetical protein